MIFPNTSDGPSDHEFITILSVSSDGILGCFVIFGNLLVLAITVRRKAMPNTTNMLVASLAVADLLMGFVYVPTSIFRKTSPWSDGYTYLFCAILPASSGFSAIVSILSMVCIGLERYRSIVAYHKEQYTLKHVKLMLVMIWGTALLALPRYLTIYTDIRGTCGSGNDYIIGRTVTLLFVSIAALFMMVLYWNIVKRLRLQIFSHSLQQRRRAVKSFVVCVVWLICCFVPIHVYTLIKSCVLAWRKADAIDHVLNPVEDLAYTASIICNSVANPIIYGICNKRMRYII